LAKYDERESCRGAGLKADASKRRGMLRKFAFLSAAALLPCQGAHHTMVEKKRETAKVIASTFDSY
jgi:hypothetical protein